MRYVLLLALLPAFLAADWLQFRGSDNNPVAAEQKLPTKFGEADSNIAWKVPLVGDGVSGPIVVGNRVFVTASSGAVQQDRLHVLAFDGHSGKQLWHRQVWATGRPFHHPMSANAAPTPASDGQRVFAFYSSNDLVCLDLDGNLLWYRGLGLDYPKAGNDVGMSSSPLIVDDTLIVQVESQGDSFAAGLDAATGENRWRIARPKAPNWASPAVLRGKDGQSVVLLQSGSGITAHNPRSGEQLWKFDAPSGGIASTTATGSRIYIPARGLTALDAAGASSPSLAWESNKLAMVYTSPVIHDGHIYVLNRAGVLVCGDEKTGNDRWQVRLKGTFWATPVIAGGHLYAANQDGQCFVVKLGAKGDLVHTADLGEGFFGTPAVAHNGLYLRSEKHLFKIAAP